MPETDGDRIQAEVRAAADAYEAEQAAAVPVLAWDAAAVDRPLPDTVIGDGLGGCLLPAGEVGILAGPSGGGKSTFTLGAAVAAAGAEDGRLVELWPDGPTVRGGPVVCVGYEDAAPWLRQRARGAADWRDRAAGDGRHSRAVADPDRLSVTVLDAPLFAPVASDPRGLPDRTGTWAALWQQVGETGALLVVIDPAALALDTGLMGYAPGPVSRFYRALRHEAAFTGAGVLVVAHVPKAARSKAADDVDAGDVAGSAAWVDRSRSALLFTRDGADGYRLAAVKANYARTGTCWPLTVRRDASGRPLAFEGGAGDGHPDTIRR